MSLNRELDPLTLRKVFAQHPSGIAALCAEIDGKNRNYRFVVHRWCFVGTCAGDVCSTENF